MEEEKIWIEKILSGDLDLFRRLIDKYQRLVCHIVFRMVGNATDREDLCQEIFIKIFRNLGKFRFESKLSTWIARIAHNTCVNHLAKKRTSLMDDLSEEERFDFQVIDDAPYPSANLERNDLSERLQDEIQRMPFRYRSMLSLFHLEGMSYNEISEIFDMPEGTVKSYLFRARKYLKQRLVAKFQPEEL